METQAPRWVEQDELSRDPDLQDLVQSLVARDGRELSVAVARSSVAPHLLVSQGAQGVSFVNRRPRTVFAVAYAGRDERFADAAGDLFEYAAQGKRIASILEEEPKARELAALGYSATPFGVMQKLPRLAGFSLEGTKMRRLRYQIGHYEKHGQCETREYQAGSDPATDRAVAGLVDEWKAGKQQIGPYDEPVGSRSAK